MKPGNKVICVNLDRVVNHDGVSTPWKGLELNEVYTISRVYPNSVTLVELTDLYAHSRFRFKTLSDIRKEKLEKLNKNENIYR